MFAQNEERRLASTLKMVTARQTQLVLWIVLVALVLRLAFIAWAPRRVTGDAAYYHAYAVNLGLGKGFIEFDGSPGILWQPGWPAVLAGLYRLFGVGPHVGMMANAIFGALTSGSLVVLGCRLFALRVGVIAGLLYALWPGNIFFAATLFTEPLAGWLVALCLTLIAIGGAQGTRRPLAWFVSSALALGLAAMVRPAPLLLLATMIVFIWKVRASGRSFCSGAASVCVAAAIVLAPWTYRNYMSFGKFVPTSGSGGHNVWLGNHLGATGGQNFADAVKYVSSHKRATFAETVLAENDTGWRDAWEFARSHPGEWLQILGRKLKFTYLDDHHAVTLIRGVGIGNDRFLSERAEACLEAVADVYWFVVLGLAVLGLVTVSSWRPEARIVVLGLLLTWTFIQLLTIGGARFHFAEEPAYALLAACSVGALADWLKGLRWVASPGNLLDQ